MEWQRQLAHREVLPQDETAPSRSVSTGDSYDAHLTGLGNERR